jgi:hypothetical protein
MFRLKHCVVYQAPNTKDSRYVFYAILKHTVIPSDGKSFWSQAASAPGGGIVGFEGCDFEEIDIVKIA